MERGMVWLGAAGSGHSGETVFREGEEVDGVL